MESEFRPGDSALLHDPYRRVREILRTDAQRESLLAMMSDEDRNKSEKRLDRIFPLPFSVEVITDALGVLVSPLRSARRLLDSPMMMRRGSY